MRTYRELVFTVLDETRTLSDDTTLENEHIISILQKHRALLIKQRYLDKKKEIPTSFYQRLNIYFDEQYYRGDIYKSSKVIPNIVDNGISHSYSYLSKDGIKSMNVNFINPQRFKFVGHNKWLRNELYATIDNDRYMYIRSPLSDMSNMVSVGIVDSNSNLYLAEDDTETYALIFDGLSDSFLVYDAIFDNPIDVDRFNDENTLDVLDLEFPCDEALIQAIVELSINEIAKINGLPRDVSNNANDDSGIAKQQN